jgi:hypothetical protein
LIDQITGENQFVECAQWCCIEVARVDDGRHRTTIPIVGHQTVMQLQNTRTCRQPNRAQHTLSTFANKTATCANFISPRFGLNNKCVLATINGSLVTPVVVVSGYSASTIAVHINVSSPKTLPRAPTYQHYPGRATCYSPC